MKPIFFEVCGEYYLIDSVKIFPTHRNMLDLAKYFPGRDLCFIVYGYSKKKSIFSFCFQRQYKCRLAVFESYEEAADYVRDLFGVEPEVAIE